MKQFILIRLRSKVHTKLMWSDNEYLTTPEPFSGVIVV